VEREKDDFFLGRRIYQNCGLCVKFNPKACSCTEKSLFEGMRDNDPGKENNFFNVPVSISI
jgi:hypothetical protein